MRDHAPSATVFMVSEPGIQAFGGLLPDATIVFGTDWWLQSNLSVEFAIADALDLWDIR